MAKMVVCALLVAAILFGSVPAAALAVPDTDPILIKKDETSDNVILLQLRLQDLGYFKYKVTGYFGEVTEDALKDFQKANALTADGVAGQKTLDVLYGNKAKRCKVEARIKPPAPKVPKVSRKINGAYRDWFDYVVPRWPKYSREKIQVIDFDTRISYYVIRVGGHYHADVEPATKADCAKLKQTYGGDWSWDRRAVLVKIKGEWIAGSINGMPHGYETIKNNGMTGQVCIHFKNSRTHIHNMRDPDHQRQVKRAAGLIR